LSKTILVTGVAGFIGSHTAQELLARGDVVIGVDNLNGYYSPARKRANLAELAAAVPPGARFSFVEGDVRDSALVRRLFAEHAVDAVIHLAAMAGVRASLDDPKSYLDVNVNGTLSLLDAAVGRAGPRRAGMPHFVFASSSSAYGDTKQVPFVETDPCDRPLAPYAASKRAAELLGHTYHHVYGLSFTAVRFFTVYGPRGRPDMMAYKVLDSVFNGRAVPLYNHGRMHRDWTYVEDIVRGVVAAVDCPSGYEIINLGSGRPVLLADFIGLIERLTGKQAQVVAAPMPDADIPYTWADISKARQLLGYNPRVTVEEGVSLFLRWYMRAVLQASGADC
jgi:UDP-glucuronate 4-epimerase